MENIYKMVEEAKNHLSKGKISEAIACIKPLLSELDTDLFNKLIVVEGNHHVIKEGFLMGFITTENYQVDRSKTTSKILTLCDSLLEQANDCQPNSLIEIHMDLEYCETCNPEILAKLKAVLGSLLDLPESCIKIKKVIPGSIRAFVELPTKAAMQLMALNVSSDKNMEALLKEFHVIEILLIDDQTAIILEKQNPKIMPVEISNSHGNVIIDDNLTQQLCRLHQASIAYRLHRLIDKLLFDLEASPESYDKIQIIQAVFQSIQRSRNYLDGFESACLGDMVSFFEENYKRELIESHYAFFENHILSDIDPVIKRRKFLDQIRAIQQDLYSKLNAYMRQNRTSMVTEQVFLNKRRTQQLLKLHNASSAYNMYRVVDSHLTMVEKDPKAFNEKDIISQLYKAITLSRELCNGFYNHELGNLYDFLQNKFSKADLGKYVYKIKEEFLKEIDPIIKRRIMLDYIRYVQQEIYAKFGDYFRKDDPDNSI